MPGRFPEGHPAALSTSPYRRGSMPPTAYTELKNLLAEVHDLGRAQALPQLGMQRTMMPAKGAAVRAEHTL